MSRIGYEYVVLVFVLALNQVSRAYGPDKIYLTIYYESKCSDSRHFIVEQLVPAVYKLQDYLMLQLIPFGKADSIDNGDGGFKCQHGPSECLGNMVQDCTLNLMRDRSYVEQVNYVACEMTTKAGSRNSMECVGETSVPTEEVQRCISSGQGTALQLDSEYLTKLLSPNYIPTITIDGIYNKQVQDSAENDLMGTLCPMLQDAPECADLYNSMAMSHILT